MATTHTDVRQVEALCRGMLHNSAARRQAAASAEPATPSVEYRTGFAAGREAGEMAGLALAVSALSGESPTDLIDQAVARAAVDAVFPVEFHVIDSNGIDSNGVESNGIESEGADPEDVPPANVSGPDPEVG